MCLGRSSLLGGRCSLSRREAAAAERKRGDAAECRDALCGQDLVVAAEVGGAPAAGGPARPCRWLFAVQVLAVVRVARHPQPARVAVDCEAGKRRTATQDRHRIQKRGACERVTGRGAGSAPRQRGGQRGRQRRSRMRSKGKGELMAAARDYCARCPGPSTQSSTRRAIWAPVLSNRTYSAELRPLKIPPQRARCELPCTHITRMPAPVSRAPRAGAGAFVPCRPNAAAALALRTPLRAVHRWALLTQARRGSAAAGSAICLGTAQSKRTHAQSVCARQTLSAARKRRLQTPNHDAISEGGRQISFPRHR